MTDLKQGFKDSTPIMAGYFSVSFTFGIMAANFGISPFTAGLISLTNLTSAGQFAGISLIYNGTTVLEMILTQFVINLRYALMSLTLTQNLDKSVTVFKRLIMSFFVTDEIFAMAAIRTKPVTCKYMLGLGVGSMASWTLGTILGAITNNLLPPSIQSALSVALYGMFIAIVMPNVKKELSVAIVCIIAISLSCLMTYAPILRNISTGFTIIICTILSSVIGAIFFPNIADIKEIEET